MAVRSGLQSGELSPAGCVAPLRESLDADNFEGKAHQDRCKGCDSCPKGHLPDGRGGCPTGIIPSYFESHRPVANTCDGSWLNENRHERITTSASTEELSSNPAKNNNGEEKTRPLSSKSLKNTL